MAKRVYKKGEPGSEYDSYHGKPEQVKRRAQRNKARKTAEREGRVSKGDGKEVDHLAKNRRGKLDNSRTRVVSKSTNRRKQPKRDGSDD